MRYFNVVVSWEKKFTIKLVRSILVKLQIFVKIAFKLTKFLKPRFFVKFLQRNICVQSVNEAHWTHNVCLAVLYEAMKHLGIGGTLEKC